MAARLRSEPMRCVPRSRKSFSAASARLLLGASSNVSAALSMLPLLATTPARAAVQFTLTDLGTLGGATSSGFALNASGQVAGSAYLPGGVSHAFRWTSGVMEDLGTLGGNYSNAYGINDAGQVAGDSYLAGNVQFRAVLWAADGTPQNLGTLGLNGSSANAINNSAAVVGYSNPGAALPNHPFLWREGNLSDLGVFGSTFSQGSANAINDAGQMVGFVGSFGAVWTPDGTGNRLLPGLGSQKSEALAINASGLIVGYALAPGTANRRVVVWQGSGIQDLGTLGGLNGTAYGLNAKGEMVGSSQTAGGGYHGFWKLSGGLVDLNTMLEPGSGATVTDARAINVHGQIAGSASIGGQNRAVLLTPTGSVTWLAGGDGSFANPARWEQAYLPNRFVDASIDSAGIQTITVGAEAGVKNLSLGNVSGSPGRPTLLLQAGATLGVSALFTVQATGTLAGDGRIDGSLLNLGSVLPTNVTVTGNFNNQGLVAGSGILNAALSNDATGQVRSGAGDSLHVLGSGHVNAGTIDISGGGQQHYGGAVANAPSGRILLNQGTLRLDGGLDNAGQVQVSYGGATVHGNVATSAGGKVILSGQSDTTFFDAVSVDAGGELRVSNGASAVFFGLVTQRTGSMFTGTGTKFYEGGLSVGDSPGLGVDAGDVNFGVANRYSAELGGTAACTAACADDAGLRDASFDKYVVAGHLAFGGELKLVSWAGFVGHGGQSFDLFDWGSVSGSFSSIDASGLNLAPGEALDFSQLYTTGVVSITAVPEPRAWALLLCGLGVVGVRARQRRAD